MEHITHAGHQELMACGFQVRALVFTSRKQVSAAHAQQTFTCSLTSTAARGNQPGPARLCHEPGQTPAVHLPAICN